MGTEDSRVSITEYYIIIVYPIYLLSQLYLYSLLCYHYQHFATATKLSRMDFSHFVFGVLIPCNLWRLYSMETCTEQRWVLRTAECQSRYIILLYYMSYLSTLSPRSILASLLTLPTLCYRYQIIQNRLSPVLPIHA